MITTKNFKHLSKKDVNIAGGKGASLGEMTQAKIQVPPGFVVLAPVFDQFLMETQSPKSQQQADLNVAIEGELDKINYSDVNSIDRASNVIRDLIFEAPMPLYLQKEIIKEFKKLKTKYVAVRSSATAEDSQVASWAGELETYLDTTSKNLLDNIKKCWSSLFTPRAIFYRQEKGLLKTKVSVAVVVQKMIESEVAGICFTVHPVTRDIKQLIIEAGWGLGEAVVSGSITPDAYVVNKPDYEILDTNITHQEKMIVRKLNGGVQTLTVPKVKQHKQKLNPKQIKALSKICIQIEKHYKKPQDIEWALAKGKFYIVQSRPITTL